MNYATQTLQDVNQAVGDNFDRVKLTDQEQDFVEWAAKIKKQCENIADKPIVKYDISYEWLKLTCNMIANMVGDKKLTAEQWWELLNNELK